MTEQNTHICYNCKNKDFELIHKGVRDNNNIDVLCCKKCGLVFLSDDSHISETFYAQGGMLGKNINFDNWKKNTESDDLRRFLFLEKKIKNKILIDFGCGNAGFLNFAKKTAQKVFGVELQKDFYPYFKECNLEVYPKIYEIGQKADIITMFHVFEHLKDPISVLSGLKPYLKDDGSIIIEVPNSNDALIKLYRNKSFEDFVYWSCHLYVFNANVLKQIVQKAGYKIKRFEYVQRYSFINHLYWNLKNKPSGHKIWAKYNLKLFNNFYSFILKLFGIADTMLIEITKQ